MNGTKAQMENRPVVREVSSFADKWRPRFDLNATILERNSCLFSPISPTFQAPAVAIDLDCRDRQILVTVTDSPDAGILEPSN